MTGLIMFVIAAIIIVLLLNKRVRNLITGKAERVMENAEKEDPDAVYRSAIKQMTSDINDLDGLADDATAMAYQVQQEMFAKRDTLKTIEGDLTLAVNAGDKEVGTALIDRRKSIMDKIAELQDRYKEYQDNADETIATKEKMVIELQELKDEYAQAATLGKADQMMDRIRKRREGIANDDISKALTSARSASMRIKAERHSEKRSAEVSLDGKIAKLRAGASSGSAASEFDALVAKK
jgi:phage shock protein A